MREIKFRAWDEHHKKMWSGEEMGKDQLTISPNGEGFVNVNGLDTRLSQYMPHLIPLQFTGLKDKNGKEIYEGDIVKNHKGTGIVTYMACVFQLENPNGIFPHVKNNKSKCNYTDLAVRTNEVMGNIYENPELLK